MKKLAIVGVSGRMGAELLALAPEFGFQVTSGVARRSPESASTLTVVPSCEKLNASEVDVVIDFSLPELTKGVADWCKANKKPLVSGVTGLKDHEKSALVEAAKNTPVLWAPNMSLGVAVLARMLAKLSLLEGFDFQIEELHHNRKKDKPSGTAVFLQERLKEAVKKEVPDPLAIRGGGIFGIHRVWAMGEEETITLEHTAMNRRVFARGAMKAAQWLIQQNPGLYKMDDVLGV
jgi:4-hydroxy-tetrahydrodipicolinate reductase